MRELLRPNPGMSDAAALSAAPGMLRLEWPGGRREYPIGPHGAVTLARYTTIVRPPRRPGEHGRRGVPRSGWRVLDAAGHTLVWLANSDREAYDPAAARHFAEGVGLRYADLGFLETSELLASAGERIGPGTSAVGAIAAPPFQWMIVGAVIGGAALLGGLFVPETGSRPVLVAITAFLGMFFGVLLAQPLGVLSLVWREQRYYRGHRAAGLRSAAGTPGLILTCDGQRLTVHDYAKAQDFSKDQSLVLAPYDVTGSGRHSERGLIVRGREPGTGKRLSADIMETFDPQELTAFAGWYSISQEPAHQGQLPKREQNPQDAIRTTLVSRLQRIAWLAPVLWCAAPVVALVGILGLSGVVDLPTGLSVQALGFALLLPSGHGLMAAQLNDSLVHPDRL